MVYHDVAKKIGEAIAKSCLDKGITQVSLSTCQLEVHVKVKKALRGVKVEVTHRGNVRRKYRISGLTAQPTRELMFPIDDQSMKSVVEYFLEVYGFTIQHTHLPCLQVGNQKKVNYLPLEVFLSIVRALLHIARPVTCKLGNVPGTVPVTL